jgi:hypothetical protein
LAKLDLKTGALDTTFSPPGAGENGFDRQVDALLAAKDVLYVGGSFTAYRGVADSAHAIAKLDAVTGALDTNFSPVGATQNGFNDSVLALAKSATALFVGGEFVNYRGGSLNAKRVAKLNAMTGELDTTFSPAQLNGFDGDVYAITVLGDSIVLGGSFSSYRDSDSLGYIAKVNATTGALDNTFSMPGTSAGFDDEVYGLAVSGSSVYAVGSFLGYRGVAGSANYMAKLDGVTGALNTTFTPAGATVGYDRIGVISAFQSSLMIGGSFSYCKNGRCYANANRVNRDTGLAE